MVREVIPKDTIETEATLPIPTAASHSNVSFAPVYYCTSDAASNGKADATDTAVGLRSGRRY